MVCNFLVYWNSTMTISTILHYFWHFNSLNYVWSSLFEMTSGPLQKEARSNSIWITCRLPCLLAQKTALKTFRQQNPAIKPKKRLQSNIRILYASLWSFTSRHQTIGHSLKCLVHSLAFYLGTSHVYHPNRKSIQVLLSILFWITHLSCSQSKESNIG